MTLRCPLQCLPSLRREQQAEPHVAMVPRSRSLLLPPPTPPVLRRHLLGRGRAALQGARLLSTATQHKVVDIAGASDTKGMSEQGNILLVEKELQFKPLERPAGAEIIVPGGGQLFASSDDPLAHTEADVGKSVRLPLPTSLSLLPLRLLLLLLLYLHRLHHLHLLHVLHLPLLQVLPVRAERRGGPLLPHGAAYLSV